MKNFKTTITALVTPFKNGNIDFKSLDKLLDRQLKGGVGGFVINGTTGESPTLSDGEVEELFHFVKKRVPSNICLIVGTGSNDTKESIEKSLKAEKWGADGVLVVVPYYNKPPQRGLIAHFNAIAKALTIPVILYNVPSRTITALSLESIKELSRQPNIIGIKEASGNIEFARQIREKCGENFILLSGDDGTYPEFLRSGGDGVISVASHLVPEVFEKIRQDDSQLALLEFSKHLELIQHLFVEANPIPVKKALALMGILDSAELRLPLMELESPQTDTMAMRLKELRLI